MLDRVETLDRNALEELARETLQDEEASTADTLSAASFLSQCRIEDMVSNTVVAMGPMVEGLRTSPIGAMLGIN